MAIPESLHMRNVQNRDAGKQTDGKPYPDSLCKWSAGAGPNRGGLLAAAKAHKVI